MRMNRIVWGIVLITAVFSQTVAGAQSSPAPARRFVDNGNETITDSFTGLMWERAPSKAAKVTFEEAQAYAESFSLAGYKDWRVPYRVELRSLVQGEQDNWAVWLDSQGFENVLPTTYWTGTWFFDSGFAYGWIVSMEYGNTSSVPQTDLHLVWLVRGQMKED